MSKSLRDLFADELGEDPLAVMVRSGADNSIGGTAAIRAMEKAVAAERERCAEEVLKCADRGLISWNAAQEIAAEIREG